MASPNDEQLLIKLHRIGASLDQLVTIQRERASGAGAWRAADLQLRQELANNQALLLADSKQAQLRQRRALLWMGALAGLMLLVGVLLLTESWWLPAVARGR